MDLRSFYYGDTSHSTSTINQRLLDSCGIVPVTIKFVYIKDGMVKPLMIAPKTSFPTRTKKVQELTTLGDIFNIMRDDIGVRAALEILRLTTEDIIDVHISVYQNQRGKMMTRAMWSDAGPNMQSTVWDWFTSQGIIPALEHLNSGDGPVIAIKLKDPDLFQRR